MSAKEDLEEQRKEYDYKLKKVKKLSTMEKENIV